MILIKLLFATHPHSPTKVLASGFVVQQRDEVPAASVCHRHLKSSNERIQGSSDKLIDRMVWRKCSTHVSLFSRSYMVPMDLNSSQLRSGAAQQTTLGLTHVSTGWKSWVQCEGKIIESLSLFSDWTCLHMSPTNSLEIS